MLLLRQASQPLLLRVQPLLQQAPLLLLLLLLLKTPTPWLLLLLKLELRTSKR